MTQGLTEHKLRSSEKHTLFNTLRRLAGKHARLPDSMVVTDEIDFSTSRQLHAAGGFADIKQGQYKGFDVAVKTLRVGVEDNFDKIRRVSWRQVSRLGGMTLRSPPAILQRGYSLEFAITPERPEACRRSGWHQTVSVRHCIGVDGTR